MFGVYAEGLRTTQLPDLQRTANFSEAAIGGRIVATELGGSLVSGENAAPAMTQTMVFAGGRFASAVAHRTGSTGMPDNGPSSSRDVPSLPQPRRGGPITGVEDVRIQGQAADNGQSGVKVLTKDHITQLPRNVQLSTVVLPL
jgi:hypothetical protein